MRTEEAEIKSDRRLARQHRHLRFVCVTLMGCSEMILALAGVVIILIDTDSHTHTHKDTFLTSDQVHVDEIWFDMSRLLWLVPQALKGETESQS